MPRYKMVLAYEGTAYSGWQVQPHACSVQGSVEKALHRILQSPIRIVGAGRTDAGVHAAGQVAHFDCDQVIENRKILYALSSLLPPDIRVMTIQEVPDSFHAQQGAIKKWYRYRLWQETCLSPFVRHFVTHITTPLSMDNLDRAARILEGKHDFTSFANIGTVLPHRVRTLYSIRRSPAPGGFYLDFEGDGFLYKMVRNLVGFLLEVGRGIRHVEEIPDIFEKRDRRCVGAAAPASGLCLMAVFYETGEMNEPLIHLTSQLGDL